MMGGKEEPGVRSQERTVRWLRRGARPEPPRPPGPGLSWEDREEVLQAAATLYRTRGFAGAPLLDIARAAGVTETGVVAAFGGAEGLFEEVYSRELRDLAERLTDRFESADPLTMLRTALNGWLDEMADPRVRQVIVVDPQVALGWDRWRRAGARHGRMLVEVAIIDAMEKGAVREQSVRPLGYVLAGAMESGVQFAARQPDPDAALADVRVALNTMVDGMVADARR